jgi:hypothetical protein
MQKLVMYDFLPHKPSHGRVAWTDGIWAELQTQLPECRDRHCLLLLIIDPHTKMQTFQHGDPGPSIEVDPARAGFAQLKDWLIKVHAEEDARLAMLRNENGTRAGNGPHPHSGTEAGHKGLLAKVFSRR